VSTSLIRQALAEVDLLEAELIEFRRDLHAHPELSWAEERTSALIGKRLDEAGLAPRSLPRNGLLVDIGSGPGPVVALRAELDALPVDDRTKDPWASTVAGVAHACGHDVHASSLLGTGLALAAIADEIPGRVRLIFQPAEEIMPGGAIASAWSSNATIATRSPGAASSTARLARSSARAKRPGAPMLNERSTATMRSVDEPEAPVMYGRANAAARSSSAAMRAASSSRSRSRRLRDRATGERRSNRTALNGTSGATSRRRKCSTIGIATASAPRRNAG